jgi:hypothetical protein
LRRLLDTILQKFNLPLNRADPKVLTPIFYLIFGRSLGVHPVMAGQNSANFNYTSRENPAKPGVSPANGSDRRISFMRLKFLEFEK